MSIFLHKRHDCAVRYDVIYHPLLSNSQYLKTWGVDSPATKNVLDLKINKTSRYQSSFDFYFVLIGIWAL